MTKSLPFGSVLYGISTHTPLAGRDIIHHLFKNSIHLFLLTRPLRDVTQCGYTPPILQTFLLTRPLRDVTNCARNWLFVDVSFLLTRPLRDVTRTNNGN